MDGKVVGFKEALEWMENGGEACIVSGAGPFSIKNGLFGFYSDGLYSHHGPSLADALRSKWRLVPKMVKLSEISLGQTLYSARSGGARVTRALLSPNGDVYFTSRTSLFPASWVANCQLSLPELTEAVWCEIEPEAPTEVTYA
jgi:hypothetical protein